MPRPLDRAINLGLEIFYRVSRSGIGEMSGLTISDHTMSVVK